MPPEPLSPQEERTWRALVRLMVILPRAIDDDLVRKTGMGLTMYVVLMNLSEAPGRKLWMSELAERTAVSPSRMTRIVDILERDGLVAREPSRKNHKVSLARLTPAGLRRLRTAWPTHLRSARELVVDHLQPDELDNLTTVLRRLIGVVEHSADRSHEHPHVGEPGNLQTDG